MREILFRGKRADNGEWETITEGKFILGNVYSRLSDISEDKKVFSIEFLDDVR